MFVGKGWRQGVGCYEKRMSVEAKLTSAFRGAENCPKKAMVAELVVFGSQFGRFSSVGRSSSVSFWLSCGLLLICQSPIWIVVCGMKS